jgi:hypothetical protein
MGNAPMELPSRFNVVNVLFTFNASPIALTPAASME